MQLFLKQRFCNTATKYSHHMRLAREQSLLSEQVADIGASPLIHTRSLFLFVSLLCRPKNAALKCNQTRPCQLRITISTSMSCTLQRERTARKSKASRGGAVMHINENCGGDSSQ